MRSEPVAIEDPVRKLFADSFDQAAQSFSQLLMSGMVISRSNLELMDGDEYINQLEELIEENYFTSLIKVRSYVDSCILLLIPKDKGETLHRILNGHDDTIPDSFDEEIIDSIGELNNIIGLTFVNCLANTLNKSINASVPENTFDFLGAVLESVVLQQELANKTIFCAEADIKDSQNSNFGVRLVIMSEKMQFMQVLNLQ